MVTSTPQGRDLTKSLSPPHRQKSPSLPPLPPSPRRRSNIPIPISQSLPKKRGNEDLDPPSNAEPQTGKKAKKNPALPIDLEMKDDFEVPETPRPIGNEGEGEDEDDDPLSEDESENSEDKEMDIDEIEADVIARADLPENPHTQWVRVGTTPYEPAEGNQAWNERAFDRIVLSLKELLQGIDKDVVEKIMKIGLDQFIAILPFDTGRRHFIANKTYDIAIEKFIIKLGLNGKKLPHVEIPKDANATHPSTKDNDGPWIYLVSNISLRTRSYML
jgi:hypothetical protein